MKTYKQFVVESNVSRDNLYEMGWVGKVIIGGLAADSLSQRIPQVLKKTNLAKPVADFTRNIPGVGPSLEKWVKSVRKEPGEKPNPENEKEDSKSNPRCPDTHKYVPATGTSKHKCVLK